MRIGIDFDNTIACYDGVFHRAAAERGLVPADLAADKASVRNHLRAAGREDDWTELQGYIYGARMDLAACYPGALAFIRRARRDGHEVFVISHKTRHPYRGPQYDLHAAATAFLEGQGLFDESAGGLPRGCCHFEPTLGDKLARIRERACDLFVDDLPEFLAEPDFPARTTPVLFDPHDAHGSGHSFRRFRSWAELARLLDQAA